MPTSILSGATTETQGSWTQVDSSTPTYVKVLIDGDRAEVEILSSETNGTGQGGQAVVEQTCYHDDSVVLPAGSYYINAEVTEIQGASVDVVAQP